MTGEIGTNTLFWCRPASNDRVMSTMYEVREAGEEIVVCMSGEAVFRTPAADPKYGDEFRSSVRSWLLARLRVTLSDPDALPPEADNFREVRPFARLDDAAEAARRTGRRILLSFMTRARRSAASCSTAWATSCKTDARVR